MIKLWCCSVAITREVRCWEFIYPTLHQPCQSLDFRVQPSIRVQAIWFEFDDRWNNFTSCIHLSNGEYVHGDLVETFKILKGKERINADTFFQLTNNSKGLRGHDLKLFKPSCKTTARQKFFSICVVNKWNRLPADMISSPTVNTYFKNRLDKHRSDMGI